MPRKSKSADWAGERQRFDADLLARAEKIYKKLAALAEEGDLKAMQLFFKELADAEGRARVGGGVDPTEITYDVVSPNNKNKRRDIKKKF